MFRPTVTSDIHTWEIHDWFSTAVLVTGGLGVAAITAAAVAASWINHDAGWYLHMAGAWLDGAVPYVDVIDTNPPLILFLTAVVVWIARALHLPLPATFKFLVFAAAVVTALASAVLVKRIFRTPVAVMLVVTALVFLLLTMVRADFGQREHITTLLVLPFVLAAAGAASGSPLPTRSDLALGLIAGLGFAMKPHFLLAWAGTELAAWVLTPRAARRSLRPGTIGVAVSLAAYALTVMVLTPQYFTVAAEVLRVYGGLNSETGALLSMVDLRMWPLGLFVLFVVPLRGTPWRSAVVAFAAATGFLLAALVQAKGWPYHLYPWRAFAGLSCSLLAAGVLESTRLHTPVRRSIQRLAIAGVVVVLGITSIRYARQTSSPSGIEQVYALHEIVVRERAESLAVLSMRTILFPAFPVVNYVPISWVMRHHSLWFLPGLYSNEIARIRGDVTYRSPGEMSPLERKYFEQVITDLCGNPPRLLVIEPPLPADRPGPRSLDLVGYFSQDARFARLWSAYHRRDSFGPFVTYLRADDAACSPRAGGAFVYTAFTAAPVISGLQLLDPKSK